VIWLTLVAGLVLLVLGGDLLVRGASSLALIFGLSPLVIGLTVVAFGTSAPELAVSVQSSLGGNPDIALGNVVGSNVFNVLFILGVSALITPLVVHQQMVKREVPIMIGASILLLLFSLNGNISLLEGLSLFAGIIAYTWFAVASARKESKAIEREYEAEFGSKESSVEAKQPKKVLMSLVLIAAGLAILVFGSDMLVKAAITLARGWGVSELVIGLTIVAAGTSLPEVAASTIAAFKGERDIAVGNVVGSNIFNILSVLGLSALVSPNGLSVSQGALTFDIPVMIAVAVACLPVFFVGYTISRANGVMFLFYYVAYTAYLVLDAQQHPAVSQLSDAMLYFVLPITGLTLGILSVRELRQPKQAETSAG
jgi:cation:H+ antiporter